MIQAQMEDRGVCVTWVSGRALFSWRPRELWASWSSFSSCSNRATRICMQKHMQWLMIQYLQHSNALIAILWRLIFIHHIISATKPSLAIQFIQQGFSYKAGWPRVYCWLGRWFRSLIGDTMSDRFAVDKSVTQLWLTRDT